MNGTPVRRKEGIFRAGSQKSNTDVGLALKEGRAPGDLTLVGPLHACTLANLGTQIPWAEVTPVVWGGTIIVLPRSVLVETGLLPGASGHGWVYRLHPGSRRR